MRQFICFLFAIIVSVELWAQPIIKATQLTDMPIPMANNAVVVAKVNGRDYVYSFGGIGTGLTYGNISQQSFRYDVVADTWDALPPLPDTLGKIASAASYVNGKIYIIGGYHVFPNGDEISSNRVHVFDPATNTYLPDAAPVPLPIDDHVQAVWRDSLIYVVAGWSNTGHVTNVQIYNPAADEWSVGTPIPNTFDYRAFGASGVFIGDTLYYMGGARTGLGYPAAPELRKGVIDVTNPTQISWRYQVYFNTAGYRMAAGVLGHWGVWLGGSSATYNYNAAAYDGSGVVVPENRILLYNPALDSLAIYTDSLPLPTMDHRGVGQLNGYKFIVCGGILGNAVVSNRTYLYEIDAPTAINTVEGSLGIAVYPVPANDMLVVEVPLAATLSLMDLSGRLVISERVEEPNWTIELDVAQLQQGCYLLRIETSQGTEVRKVWISR